MKPSRRKLLVAAAGVAAVNYVASCQPTTGNLMLPNPDPDASVDAAPEDAAPDRNITSGNLMAPLVDAGPDVDATDLDAGSD